MCGDLFCEVPQSCKTEHARRAPRSSNTARQALIGCDHRDTACWDMRCKLGARTLQHAATWKRSGTGASLERIVCSELSSRQSSRPEVVAPLLGIAGVGRKAVVGLWSRDPQARCAAPLQTNKARQAVGLTEGVMLQSRRSVARRSCRVWQVSRQGVTCGPRRRHAGRTT